MRIGKSMRTPFGTLEGKKLKENLNALFWCKAIWPRG